MAVGTQYEMIKKDVAGEKKKVGVKEFPERENQDLSRLALLILIITPCVCVSKYVFYYFIILFIKLTNETRALEQRERKEPREMIESAKHSNIRSECFDRRAFLSRSYHRLDHPEPHEGFERTERSTDYGAELSPSCHRV